MDDLSVLLVEDDVVARQIMAGCLRNAGYAVSSVESGEAALELLGDGRYQLLVTDIGLAGLDGVALITAARQADPQLEIIVVTGAASIASAMAACNNGAWRYLLKPVRPQVLEESAAAALTRRRERVEQAQVLRQLGSQLLRLAEGQAPFATPARDQGEPFVRVGEVTIDLQRYEVSVRGQPVQLTRIQFDLLLYLARHAEQVITPRELVLKVLGYEATPIQAGEVLKGHIYNLRNKIEREPTAPKLLLSRRGVGYMLTAGG